MACRRSRQWVSRGPRSHQTSDKTGSAATAACCGLAAHVSSYRAAAATVGGDLVLRDCQRWTSNCGAASLCEHRPSIEWRSSGRELTDARRCPGMGAHGVAADGAAANNCHCLPAATLAILSNTRLSQLSAFLTSSLLRHVTQPACSWQSGRFPQPMEPIA